MSLVIDSELIGIYPDLKACIIGIEDVKIQKKDKNLEKFKIEIINQVKNSYDLISIKHQPIFRAYRDFFWRVGIDPTKNRPAAEALIRRILAGKNFPSINTLVDTYNLASIKSGIALATFDSDKIKGNLHLRFAKKGEKMIGIGMKNPLILEGGEIIVTDEEKLVAIYPYRDSENTKITKETKNIILIVCGVPGIQENELEKASKLVTNYIKQFCNGKKSI